MVGNHLAQHRELSLLAIGLAVHIQSVPDGTRVDIKSLSARFPEGEARIAAALRELEAHGYLARTVSRTPAGRVVTRTVSYAHPAAAAPCAPPDRPTPAPRGTRKSRPRHRHHRPHPPKPRLQRPSPRSGPHSPRPEPPTPPGTPQPPRCSPPCTATTTVCCCPSGTQYASPPPWRPGWSAEYGPRPYAAR
ncbi:hypothetical protein ACWV95_22670 [Streptomyces albus]